MFTNNMQEGGGENLVIIPLVVQAVQRTVLGLPEHLHQERLCDAGQDPALPPGVLPLLSLHQASRYIGACAALPPGVLPLLSLHQAYRYIGACAALPPGVLQLLSLHQASRYMRMRSTGVFTHNAVNCTRHLGKCACAVQVSLLIMQ